MTIGDNRLHEAIRWEGDIRPLIRAGLDIDQQNAHHMTPLYVAVYQGNRDAVQALIAAGANTAIIGIENRFPLDEAIHQARIDIALDLIAAGAPMLPTSLVDAVRLYDPKPALALIALPISWLKAVRLLDRAVRGLGKLFWTRGFEPKVYGQAEVDRAETRRSGALAPS